MQTLDLALSINSERRSLIGSTCLGFIDIISRFSTLLQEQVNTTIQKCTVNLTRTTISVTQTRLDRNCVCVMYDRCTDQQQSLQLVNIDLFTGQKTRQHQFLHLQTFLNLSLQHMHNTYNIEFVYMHLTRFQMIHALFHVHLP